MTSDLWQPKIHPYVDSELPAEETRAMGAHLRECSSCAAEALRLMQLKHATHLAARRYTPSAQFRRKLAGQYAARRPVLALRRWALPLTAAAIILMVGGALLRLLPDQRSQRLLSELTDLHVANLAASTRVDVVSSDRHTVKPWFQGKLPFTFNLPELQGSPFTLVGGRLTFLDHEPGAHLIYDAGSHHISVFIFRDQPDLARVFSTRELPKDVLTFRVESWSAHDVRYFVVGDASDQDIQALVAVLKKAGDR